MTTVIENNKPRYELNADKEKRKSVEINAKLERKFLCRGFSDRPIERGSHTDHYFFCFLS